MMALQGAPPAPTPPFSCADVNGDGQVDITDPAYLLDWLFNGSGLPPCRVYPPVLKTGQTTCWNNSALINCPTDGQTFYGQDASYKAGLERRYQDNANGTITDLTTGLMWVKQPTSTDRTWINTLNYANSFNIQNIIEWRLPSNSESFTIVDWDHFSPSLTPVVFDFSLIPADQARFWMSTTLTFDVRRKWRLNYQEGHIADNVYTNTRKAWPVRSGIPPASPPNTPPTPVPPFWCGDANGDAHLDITDVSYILDYLFNGGAPPCIVQGTVLKTGVVHCYNEAGSGSPTQQIPCQPPNVSGGGQDGYYQTGLPRSFQNNGDGTVLDLTTGLTWIASPVTVTIQQLGGNGRLTWQNALSFCQGLSFAGHDDWRLPNVNELSTMVNFGREGANVNDPVAKIYSQFFTVPAATNACLEDGSRVTIPFWTSTTSTSPLTRSNSFAVNFSDGTIHNDRICNNKTTVFFVWPVRGGLDP